VCEHVFVRWQNLTMAHEREATLPGFKEPAVVRTFDAPEAIGTRFYEIRARSAINKVPERSRMPFRYTINPYRGCAHACTYCCSGDTQILLANGRTKALSDVQVGDAIYGTVPWGRYRRYVVTRVHAHWTAHKKAYRVTLEDGTELIASGDHRFLSDRGWKHIAGAEWGRGRRPHLTLNNRLVGMGNFAIPPADSREYRRGYLCGVIRGDGHVASYSYDRPGRMHGDVHRFRLALTDIEALRRTREYLLDVDVATDEFQFLKAGAIGEAKPMAAIRTQARERVERVREVIGWPRSAGDDWCKGFLAGIFDAEGSYGGCIRIANTDPTIVDWITWCLRRLGFDCVIENTKRANELKCVRLRGGLRENIRFFHTVDPAITRKRTIAGTAVKSTARLGVVSIERMGPRELFDITTGTGDFIANGVVSHNCFARPTHTYLDFNAREDFEREIVVKVNVPEVVRAELARPSWQGDHVALGTNTDPYQWVEGRYRLMEGIWEAMRDFANPCSVLTKSPLLLRDIELMKQLVKVTDFAANLSVPTLDEKAWRETEPHTPHPRKRLEAAGELNRAGIPTGVLIAPLMPGINDAPGQVEEILELAGEAGARTIGGVGLHLRGEVREIWFDWLRSYRPDLVPRYEALYARGAYLPRPEQERLSRRARRGRGVSDARRIRDEASEADAAGGGHGPAGPRRAQTSLFPS
jgi:DNA repair photolyase